MRKVLEILTPENVFVEYELAGLGSRGIAYFIDSLIKWVLTIVAYIGLFLTIDLKSYSSNGIPSSKYPLLAGIGFLVIFLINTGYFIIFEMIMKGQTPGKKAMKLRVIKENGEPINFFDSLLRNLLRIIENTFTLNILGSLFIIFSPNYKRIGDYSAGTIVVKVRKEEKTLTAEAL
ncbi:MAG TPA: RDD family protein, partial [Clostridia bacterium]|nr:RDD family protein [Clostridia bacterium]